MDLKEMQKVVYKNKIDKGFNVTDVNKEFCLLYGEVAEAYEAYRKKKGIINLNPGEIYSAVHTIECTE
ncbi:MAG: hypothetical protein IJB70_07735 [Clostridia bacterium]|nr:hypothetical protein [Clostridia bacterium]